MSKIHRRAARREGQLAAALGTRLPGALGGSTPATPTFADVSTLDYALAYAARGLHLFAVAARSKVPLAGSHGHLDATTDPAALRDLFSRRSHLNLALSCAASGLVVLDEDLRSGGDETRARLEREHGVLPHTPRVLSGAGDGSTHYYFQAPPGVTFPRELGAGLEVKHHGFVLLPPSVHRSGNAYVWDVGALLSETPIAPCPAWIVRLSRRRREARATLGPASESFLAVAFRAAGWLGRELPDGKLAAICPWADEHTDHRGRGEDSSCALLPPTTDDRLGTFVCAHAHCTARRTVDALIALDDAAVAPAADAFPAAYARALCLVARRAA